MAQSRLEKAGWPTGLRRLMFRAPVGLYRLGLGFVLGRRFLMREHRGRKTGIARRTVLEVVGDDVRNHLAVTVPMVALPKR